MNSKAPQGISRKLANSFVVALRGRRYYVCAHDSVGTAGRDTIPFSVMQTFEETCVCVFLKLPRRVPDRETPI